MPTLWTLSLRLVLQNMRVRSRSTPPLPMAPSLLLSRACQRPGSQLFAPFALLQTSQDVVSSLGCSMPHHHDPVMYGPSAANESCGLDVDGLHVGKELAI